jgi:hypothetical protein
MVTAPTSSGAAPAPPSPSPVEASPPPDPPPAVAVLSADASGRQIVSVHVKRAYRILPTGACVPAHKPVPLLFSREPSADDLGVPESDVIPFKESTDVIVMTKAHALAGASVAEVRVRVGEVARVYRVFGARRCLYRGPGSVAFSRPEPFESVPLSYALAYGGIDETWPMPDRVPLEDALFLPPNAYPRNTIGLGYAIGERRERLDGLLLPQVENPADLLNPERLVVPDPSSWWRQPFPWSCDWFDALWYPRYGFFGALPRGTPEDDREMFEVRSGWVEAGQLRRFGAKPPADRLDVRFADAASPALILPFLKGGEAVRLDGVMPGGGSIVLSLPAETPRVIVRVAGETFEPEVRLHRVLISTVEMGVYLVWHAAVHPSQPLPLERPTLAKKKAPLDLAGVEVTADGVHVPSFDEWEAGG